VEYLLKDKEVVVFELPLVSISFDKPMRKTDQVIICIPCLSGLNRVEGSKVVKHTLGWLRPIVKQEHDPGIEHQGMLSCHDDCGLIVGIVLGKVADGLQDLWCFVGSEDVVSSPNLLSLELSNTRAIDKPLRSGEFRAYRRSRCPSCFHLP
jgi:hypothetical protein